MDNPAFLTNQLRLDLGVRSNGKRVDDIKLPKWAQSPAEYLSKNREALESNYVSENIHLWIDLIFGTKQCSIEAKNVFHPVTYQGRINLDQLQDPVQRAALEVQITEFGQTPKQIFFADHPQRFSKIPKPVQIQESEDGKVLGRGEEKKDNGSLKSNGAAKVNDKEEDDDEDDEEEERKEAEAASLSNLKSPQKSSVSSAAASTNVSQVSIPSRMLESTTDLPLLLSLIGSRELDL